MCRDKCVQGGHGGKGEAEGWQLVVRAAGTQGWDFRGK